MLQLWFQHIKMKLNTIKNSLTVKKKGRSDKFLILNKKETNTNKNTFAQIVFLINCKTELKHFFHKNKRYLKLKLMDDKDYYLCYLLYQGIL